MKQMYKRNDWTLWLYLVPFALIALVACSQREDYGNIGLEEVSTNADALQFIKAVNGDSKSLAVFKELTSGRHVFLSRIKLGGNSAHGIYYFVPFGEIGTGEVTGALYYPVDYTWISGERLKVNNKLGSPRVVDANAIEHEIPIGERFLYSHRFVEFENENGIKVDNRLKAYEFLKDSTLYLEDSQLPVTRCYNPSSDEPMLIMEVKCDAGYVGQPDGVIYGLRNETFEKYAKEAMWRLGINERMCYFHSNWFHWLEIAVPYGQMIKVCTGAREFVNIYSAMLSQIGFREHFQLNLQVTYREHGFGDSHITPGAPGGGTHGHTGSTNDEESHGSYTDSWGTGQNDKAGKSKIGFECDSITYSAEAKSSMRNIIDNLLGVKAFKLGPYDYIDFDEFCRIVKQKSDVEHASLVGLYDDNVYRMTRPETVDDAHRAPFSLRRSTCFILHNHPDCSPPSATDLLNVCEAAASEDCPNMQGTVVYVNDTTFYALIISDRVKAANMYRKIKDDVDFVTNDFKKGGMCEKILEGITTKSKLNSKDEKLISRLMMVNNYFDGGIRLVKCHRGKTAKYTVYGTEKKSYKTIKC